MFKIKIVAAILYFNFNISIANSTTLVCPIFSLDPLYADVLGAGKLVHHFWSGKFDLIIQRNWNLVPKVIEVDLVCDRDIKRDAGKTFLYFTSHERASKALIFDDHIMLVDSPQAKTAISKFANRNDFIGEINPSWQFCESDNECLQVYNKCGNPVGVNKKYKDTYLDFLKTTAKKFDCSKIASHSSISKCIDHFCSEPDVKVRTFFGFQI